MLMTCRPFVEKGLRKTQLDRVISPMPTAARVLCVQVRKREGAELGVEKTSESSKAVLICDMDTLEIWPEHIPSHSTPTLSPAACNCVSKKEESAGETQQKDPTDTLSL